MSPVDQPTIEYGLPEASEAESMATLIGEIFSRRDPPAYAVGLTPDEFEAFAHLLCPKAIDDGLTIVARRADTGELVGVMLTEDCAADMPAGMDQLSSKFDPILDLLGQLNCEYWGERSVQAGDALHLFLLGVASEVAGRGVGQRLVAECLEHGRRKGYPLAVTEATNRVSQHIFRKAGFVERVRRSYESHRFEGKSFFESIADEGGPALMDRSLLTP